MRDRVLAIVTLLTQLMEVRDLLNEDDLIGELLAVGFDAEEIDAAFRWIESAAIASRLPTATHLAASTNRVFSAEEVRLLSPDARGFLLRLRAMGILDDELHEEVIDRAVQMAEEEVSLQELKTVIALTLFARSHDQWRREVECLFEEDWTRIYH